MLKRSDMINARWCLCADLRVSKSTLVVGNGRIILQQGVFVKVKGYFMGGGPSMIFRHPFRTWLLLIYCRIFAWATWRYGEDFHYVAHLAPVYWVFEEIYLERSLEVTCHNMILRFLAPIFESWNGLPLFNQL